MYRTMWRRSSSRVAFAPASPRESRSMSMLMASWKARRVSASLEAIARHARKCNREHRNSLFGGVRGICELSPERVVSPDVPGESAHAVGGLLVEEPDELPV